MNRRYFFRGVGAAAAALALEPVPEVLAPVGRWVIYHPTVRLVGVASLASAIWRAELLRQFAERDSVFMFPRGRLEELLPHARGGYCICPKREPPWD